MKTTAVTIAGGPHAHDSFNDHHGSMAPYIAHTNKCDAITYTHMRERMMELEVQVCGSVSRPGFVGKDHCRALQISEADAWHHLKHGTKKP